MEIIVEHTPSVETRPLDSLARLLENTIYITTNDIYAVSTKLNKQLDNQGLKYLKAVTNHFLSKSFRESEEFTDADINILLTNYKGKFNSQYIRSTWSS